MTPSRARLKKALFFCRPSIPLNFNNDPVKFTVKSTSPWARFILGCLPRPLNSPFMTLHVSERIVEVPFVFANLRVPKGGTVIDLGCAESSLSLMLANLGFKVWASDLRPYGFNHPNLTALTGDFAAVPIKRNSVDAVIAVSTLEHIGLDCYGGQTEVSSELKIVAKVRTVLKPGGQFLITVPYGIKNQTDWYRVYDRESLRRLLADFDFEKTEYYRRVDRSTWEETSEAAAAEVASPQEANCVALVAAVNRKR